MLIPEIQTCFYKGGLLKFHCSLDELPMEKNKASLGDEEYIVDINWSGIKINYGSERGLFYAENTLKRLVQTDGSNNVLPFCYIRDYPRIKMRGIIEGFYGKPWSHNERLDLIEFISKYKMNTFFYAPKDDEYHRKKWRETYPEEKLKEIIELIECCRTNHVDFIFSVSPGIDITYSSQDEFEMLCNKFSDIMELGVTKIALLLDDIDVRLNSQDYEFFGNDFCSAQVYLANRVYQYFKNKYSNLEFIVCPTEYWGIKDSDYKRKYKDLLEKDITLIWTGKEVISSVITRDETEISKQLYGHNILLWDNFPVNDGTFQLKLGPLKNRDKELGELITGIVSNPMNEAELSKPAIMTYADYSWNPEAYIPEYSYEKALKEYDEDNIELYHLLYENCQTSNLNDEYAPILKKLIEEAISVENYNDLKKYLMDIEKLNKDIGKLKNKKLLGELEGYRNKIEYTIKLGLCSIDILEGVIREDFNDILNEYKKIEYKFAGDYIIDIAEYCRVKSMTLKEKLGQIFMVDVDRNKNITYLVDFLKKNNVGNVLFSGRYENLDNLKCEVDQYKNICNIIPFIAAEHEGGEHYIVNERYSCMCSQNEIGAIRDKGCAYNNAYLQAMELKTLGFNFVLAPVLNLKDEIHEFLSSRCFGENLQENVIHTSIRAYKVANLVACAKSFPIYENEPSSRIDKTYSNLKNQINAFYCASSKGAPAMLVSNAVVEELDEDLPVCFSDKVLQNMLRNMMGFEGIITVKLEEKGLSYEKLIKYILAGVNLFIIGDISRFDKLVEEVCSQADESIIKSIDASLVRILKAKEDIKDGKIDESKFEFYDQLRDNIIKRSQEALKKHI